MGNLVSIERKTRTAIVRFDTGSRANALSPVLMQELTSAAQSFHACPDISTVILTGRDDQFCMGADLKDSDRSGSPKAPHCPAPWPRHVRGVGKD